MIIFIKGYSAPLNYFIDCMAEGRDDAIILDVSKPDQMFKMIEEWDPFINGSAVVITFNNAGVFLNTQQGNYWEQKQAALYNYYVDHPVNYVDEIEKITEIDKAFKNIRFLLIDACHCEFVKNNFKDIADQAYFLPHGGSAVIGAFGSRERDIDILYVGSCWPDFGDYPKIGFLDGTEAEFYSFCYHMYKKEAYFQVDHVVDSYICQSGRQFTAKQRMEMISLVSITVERRFVRDLRYTFLRTVAEAGMRVQIYGSKYWEGIQDGVEDRIAVSQTISPEECIRQMGRAKIVVNIQPVFTFGGHERVFNSMLNGAVCVSSQSKYLENLFEHKKDIIFIDFHNLEETVNEMKRVLGDASLFEQIRQNAYAKVQYKNTWKARLLQILSLNGASQ